MVKQIAHQSPPGCTPSFEGYEENSTPLPKPLFLKLFNHRSLSLELHGSELFTLDFATDRFWEFFNKFDLALPAT